MIEEKNYNLSEISDEDFTKLEEQYFDFYYDLNEGVSWFAFEENEEL